MITSIGESFEKLYEWPLKSKRLVDTSNGHQPYQRIDSLAWTFGEGTLWQMCQTPQVRLASQVESLPRAFRSIDYVVANDLRP